MPIEVNIVVAPEVAASPKQYEKIAAQKMGISVEQISLMQLKRKSIDARSRNIKVNMSLTVYLKDEEPEKLQEPEYRDVSNAMPVVVVGSGPAGLFAALRLIELGFKPIVLERGKDVSSRKIDLANINRNKPIPEDSNYCFGEGGAGTYSDGKLYTRSKKRGNWQRALYTLHLHGANEAILYEAHPHIGTDRLPRVIANIRETIRHWGGEVRFECRVTDFIIEKGVVRDRIKGVVTQNGDKVEGVATIVATGHSARDIYELLHAKNVRLESKAFAMGVRVEHPQGLIDAIQYKRPNRGEYLPAASYSLVAQVGGRGVYSFCMCPGGFIVPAGTKSGESVVNGMSPSGRNSLFANSGIVTEIRAEDYAFLVPEYGVLAGLKYQQMFEQEAFAAGGGAQIVPAQRLTDFVSGTTSKSIGRMSYHPSGVSSNMKEWMPQVIYNSLRGGFEAFGKTMRGFVTHEAMVLGVESRTSSPIRIPRDTDTLQHPEVEGLYPAGEGAGYAGGIISAAVDGERIAEMIEQMLRQQLK